MANPTFGRLVKVKEGCKGFLEGTRFVTTADPPFRVSDHRAGNLIERGLAEPVAVVSIGQGQVERSTMAEGQVERSTMAKGGEKAVSKRG